MTTNIKFNRGDKVKLKSDSPAMTVTEVYTGGQCTVSYFDTELKLHEAHFHQDCLDLLPDV